MLNRFKQLVVKVCAYGNHMFFMSNNFEHVYTITVQCLECQRTKFCQLHFIVLLTFYEGPFTSFW